MGDYAAAEHALNQRAKLVADQPLEVARDAIRRAELAERVGNVAAVERWIRRGLRAIEGVETAAADAERAYLFTRRAGVHYRLGRPKDAVRWATRAVATAQRSGRKAPQADAYTMLDTALVAAGRLERATNSEKAAALYRSLRHRNSLAVVLNNAGAMAYYQGRWQDALRLYDEARRNFEQVGNAVDAALGRSNIAEIFADQGRLDEAEQLLRDAIEAWRSLAFPVGTARATRYLARVVLRRDDPDVALQLFDEARATFLEHGMVGTVHEVDVWRAECLLRLGRTGEAGALLDHALAAEISNGSTDLRPMVHRLRAALAAAEGRPADAWAEADESLHHARSRNAPFEVALALETIATLARLGGRPLEEDARREQEELLTRLGVVAPPPPLPFSAGRA
jgi:tetratricopeptide (TPR) repeat protein